jgi:hypothetical protein
MSTINGVDFGQVANNAVTAGIGVITSNASGLREVVENVAEGIVHDLAFVARKKANGEFEEEDARIFMEDQKTLARIRIRSIGIVTAQIAERVWNAMAQVFRQAINTALGWTLL